MVSFSHAFALLAKPVQVKHFSELLQEARTNMEAMPPKMKNFFIKRDFSLSKVGKAIKRMCLVN
jgi:hypothetical protein